MQKKQDSDILNCVNAIADAQISIKAILPRGGISFNLEHMVLIFFRKYKKSAIDRYLHGHIWKTSFFALWGTPGGLFCPKEVLC